MTVTSTVLGSAGEHYVMCQLLRRGLIAALAPVGVPNTDIIVTNELGSRLCAVQVKTRVEKGRDRGWHMRKKHEQISEPTLFYTFIDFGSSLVEQPICYVVPSAVVADVVYRSHAEWLSRPGKSGRQRQDSDVRRFLPDYEQALGVDIGCGQGWLDKYREAWGYITDSSA